MSELLKNPELFVEFITLKTPFESLGVLKDLVKQNKTICFSFNEDNFSLKVWTRQDDGQVDLLHKEVDPDHSIRGTFKVNKTGTPEYMYEFVRVEGLTPEKKQMQITAIKKKIEQNLGV